MGATMRPATAPNTAASPQPSASIQLTRMPASRLDTGFCAAARMASPRGVKRKKAKRSGEHHQRHADLAEVMCAEHHGAHTDGLAGERAREGLLEIAPHPAGDAIADDEESQGHDHDGQDGLVLDGPDDHTLDGHAPTKAMASVARKAPQ